MQRFKATLTPVTAFATELKGDTLFGQLCWALRHTLGNAALNQMLEGYTEGQPFLVLSDALPAGYLPRPKAPSALLGFDLSQSADRKLNKGKVWLPQEHQQQPLNQWHSLLKSSAEIGLHREISEQYHNTINRLTNGTGTGQFAPYSVQQWVYPEHYQLDIYGVFDPDRITADSVQNLLTHCGLSGFGKDVTAGLGKFELNQLERLPDLDSSQQVLTLAPSVLPADQLVAEACFYNLFTRFGKHGAEAALSGKPFKNPVVMADTAALLTLKTPGNRSFIGTGVGGKDDSGQGKLSLALPETLQQGYSPVIALNP